MIAGWRYYWRRYLGFVPVQFCMVCSRPYWGGLPRFSREWVSDRDHRKFIPGKNCWRAWVVNWMPWWKDYCSMACCKKDAAMGGGK